MAHSQMNVVKFYQSVIDDVISGVRENFLDEGMDEQVLQELKQLWETKVLSSKAVEVGPDNSEPQPPQLLMTKGNGVSLGMVAKTVAMPGQTQILTPVTTSMHNVNNSQLHLQQHHQTQQLQQQSHQQQSHQQQSHQQQQHQQQQQQHQQTLQQQLMHQQTQQANAPPQPTQQTVIVADPNKTVPVQITLPAPAGTVTIHVPVSALQGNTLQTSLTGPVITAAMALPPQVATTLLQQHVLAALQAAQQQQTQQQQQATIQQIPRQTDGQDDSDTPGCSGHSQRTTEVILQLDGHNDTSDEEDEDVDDDGDDDDEDEAEDRVDDDENEDEANGGGQEEEPLNSGDDVSEDDPTDLFDTDNVIVCQYDKITRSRNKWKFYLKDGIMNLNGKDFVFQKSNGDAEW